MVVQNGKTAIVTDAAGGIGALLPGVWAGTALRSWWASPLSGMRPMFR
jgi:hypothetical protein